MAKMLCTECLSVGKPTSQTRGSFLIEVVLWLAFILPGVVYSLWRLSTRRKGCSQCGSVNVIPLDTPRAQQLLRAAPPGQQA